MISHLLLTEPAPLTAHEDQSTNDSSLRVLLTLCDLLNRELLVLIGWAKQIPGTNLATVHLYLLWVSSVDMKYNIARHTSREKQRRRDKKGDNVASVRPIIHPTIILLFLRKL